MRPRASSMPTAPTVRTTARAHGRRETRRAGGYHVRADGPSTSTRSPPHLEAFAWRRGDGMAHPVADPLERDGDGRARTASRANSAATSPASLRRRRCNDVGFNHFWRAPQRQPSGRPRVPPGHSSPGVYARSFLEGRISEEQLDLFRMEVAGHARARPRTLHPWLMPEYYWQVPTASMGSRSAAGSYQARTC